MPAKSPSQRSKHALLALAAIVVLAAVFTLVFYDWGYGEVSPNGYRYATALYSICNQQDEARLAVLVSKIEQAKANNELEPNEAAWIEGIVQQAERGAWDAAAKRAKRLMQDQIKR